jgi:hypothetical protein
MDSPSMIRLENLCHLRNLRINSCFRLSSHHARGSAMTETVLVLPLILVVLALLFFFGQAMTRWQRSSVTDRYEAWRQAQYAPGPGVSFNKDSRNFGPADLLNEAFFAGNADRLDVADRAGRISIDEPTDLIAEETLFVASGTVIEGYEPAWAEDYARELHRRLPAWWRIDLATEHESSVPLYQRFAGAVKHQHTLIDGDWSFATWVEQKYRGVRLDIDRVLTEDVYLNSHPKTRDGLIDLYNYRPYAITGIYHVYYEDPGEPLLDEFLQDLEDQDNGLASAVRGIYVNVPGYVGPQLLPEVRPRILRLDTRSDPTPGQSP